MRTAHCELVYALSPVIHTADKAAAPYLVSKWLEAEAVRFQGIVGRWIRHHQWGYDQQMCQTVWSLFVTVHVIWWKSVMFRGLLRATVWDYDTLFVHSHAIIIHKKIEQIKRKKKRSLSYPFWFMRIWHMGSWRWSLGTLTCMFKTPWQVYDLGQMASETRRELQGWKWTACLHEHWFGAIHKSLKIWYHSQVTARHLGLVYIKHARLHVSFSSHKRDIWRLGAKSVGDGLRRDETIAIINR